jgi:hypothetical protein
VPSCGPSNDRYADLLEQSSASIHVLSRTGTQAEVVKPHSLLHEALASKRRVAGFNADRGSSADAVE